MADPLSIFDAFDLDTPGDEQAEDSNQNTFHETPGFSESIITSLATKISVEELESGHNCTHHRVFPSDHKREWKLATEPAKQYPFKLDDFQKRSIECLENNESVLVCAHTSAGKTVVAEYAIAMGLRDKRRIVYTSPIKALSNQKYRNLSDEFADVGLMTGDVTLNANASVMVLTTEILRSMLYRGSEIVQEMKWVIFDEVHYMRDQERGVVWEESIILIPPQVNLVFLSATIPNSIEFAEWICRIKNIPCNVITTDYRPTPLQHYIFPSNGSGIHLVLDGQNFREEGFQEALSGLGETNNNRKRGRGTKDIELIVSMCSERKFTPVIIFAFSKADCEANATAVRHMDMTEAGEKVLIESIYGNAMAMLSEEDRKLPQALFMLPLLRNGIGIHHGGLLPIIKEIVEILFQEGLLRVLFSTETFAMGVNMPAKSVVFTKLRKWDGQNVRLINSGEYIQMAGRAGRRGLDEHGMVIIIIEEGIKPEECRGIILGKANRLQSTFHLGYNMLLNLMRIEDTTPEFMIERSFLQFQRSSNLRSFEDRMEDVNLRLIEAESGIEPSVRCELAAIYSKKVEVEELTLKIARLVAKDARVLKFLNFGRLVNGQWGWGVVMGTKRTNKSNTVDCLVLCDKASVKSGKSQPTPSFDLEEGIFQIVSFPVEDVRKLSQIKMNLKKDFRVESDYCQIELKTKFRQLRDHFKSLDALPLLDPIENMGIQSPQLNEALRRIAECEKTIKESPISIRPDFDKLTQQYAVYIKLTTEKRELELEMQNAHQIVMKDELRQMKNLLKVLNYVDENGVTIKGRVACEINATDELVVAELFLSNFFENMPPEYICALLSCLVVDEKKDEKLPTDMKLLEGFNKIREVASEIAKVMIENNMDVNQGEFVNKFKSSLMTIVLRWAKEDSFVDILSESTVFEGSVIRCIRRLEELLRQLACASRNVGNFEMEKVFVSAINKLKKGIAFTSSLYL